MIGVDDGAVLLQVVVRVTEHPVFCAHQVCDDDRSAATRAEITVDEYTSSGIDRVFDEFSRREELAEKIGRAVVLDVDGVVVDARRERSQPLQRHVYDVRDREVRHDLLVRRLVDASQVQAVLEDDRRILDEQLAAVTSGLRYLLRAQVRVLVVEAVEATLDDECVRTLRQHVLDGLAQRTVLERAGQPLVVVHDDHGVRVQWLHLVRVCEIRHVFCGHDVQFVVVLRDPRVDDQHVGRVVHVRTELAVVETVVQLGHRDVPLLHVVDVTHRYRRQDVREQQLLLVVARQRRRRAEVRRR